MLQNEYLTAKIGVDTAENEPIGKSDLENDSREPLRIAAPGRGGNAYRRFRARWSPASAGTKMSSS